MICDSTCLSARQFSIYRTNIPRRNVGKQEVGPRFAECISSHATKDLVNASRMPAPARWSRHVALVQGFRDSSHGLDSFRLDLCEHGPHCRHGFQCLPMIHGSKNSAMRSQLCASGLCARQCRLGSCGDRPRFLFCHRCQTLHRETLALGKASVPASCA